MQKKDNAPNNQLKKSHIKSQVKVGSICARDDLQVFDDEQHVVYSHWRGNSGGGVAIEAAAQRERGDGASREVAMATA